MVSHIQDLTIIIKMWCHWEVYRSFKWTYCLL